MLVIVLAYLSSSLESPGSAWASTGAALSEGGGGSAWQWPVKGTPATPYTNDNGQPYAARMHRGIDIAAPVGARVVAARPGTVRYAGPLGSSGLVVSVLDGDGQLVESYLHLAQADVQPGEVVRAGQVIGRVGMSGRRSLERPHLHFGVRAADSDHYYFDPLDFLPPLDSSDLPVVPPAAARTPLPSAKPALARAPALNRVAGTAAAAPRLHPYPAPLPRPSPRPAGAPALQGHTVERGLAGARERGGANSGRRVVTGSQGMPSSYGSGAAYAPGAREAAERDRTNPSRRGAEAWPSRASGAVPARALTFAAGLLLLMAGLGRSLCLATKAAHHPVRRAFSRFRLARALATRALEAFGVSTLKTLLVARRLPVSLAERVRLLLSTARTCQR